MNPQKTRAACAALMLANALLAGCASTDSTRTTDAVTAPLNDLNLVQADIPPKLLAVQKQPYLVPPGHSCGSLAFEVKELDDVLGPDLDAPPSVADTGLVARGTDEVKGAAFGALRSTTEGLVPFRGWVRKLSGAERYSKQVEAAIAAGTVRRAFLKGLMAARACAPAIVAG
ncbi:hypothetical protein LRH25_07020 [Ideonella azotifigens]|uniref:hypothetical protein n=1 Tax=Ideonella azotifigens TaxID=513160 RepID=UPI001E3E7458|nr:hypothetical protein [Ideonella azotifigens]MCD2340092.1 hypothetical protein [Ideonella azotifigens]